MASAKNDPTAKTLMDAVRSNDVKALRASLDNGANVNTVVKGYTALGLAVECGSTRLVKVLLAAGADPNRGARIDPLHEAIREKRLAIAQALIQAGADVNCKIDNGTTPLMMAVFTGSAKAVQILLDADADAKLENDNLECAYEIALKRQRKKIAELLAPVSDASIRLKLESVPGAELLYKAAENGDLEEVRRIIGTGVDVNAIAPACGDTALSKAAWHGHLDIVSALLEAGALPNVFEYWPPLAQASFRGEVSTMRKLLEAGADVNAPDDESALARAATEAHLEAAEMLIEAGADVNACGRSGKTPLSQAYDYEWRYRKRNPVIDLLLEHGADNLGVYEKAYSNWKRPATK